MVKLKNRKYDSVIIIGSTIVLLSILSYLQTSEIHLGNFTIKPVAIYKDLFSSIKEKVKIAKIDTTVNLKVNKNGKLSNSAIGISLNNSDSSGCLSSFFNSLNETKKSGTQTRIAYFGDSQIEGDLVTQTLRYLFQRDFGGEGIGMIPIVSNVSQFRSTIKHQFSENWDEFNFMKTSKTHPLGITGSVFIPMDNSTDKEINKTKTSWVSYKFTNNYSTAKSFSTIKLFYAKNSSNSQISYSLNDSVFKKNISGEELVNQLVLSNSTHSFVNLSFNSLTPLDLYCTSFESSNGVILDNYSFRGTSGLNLLMLRKDILTEFNKYLDYKLIVLEYGINVADPATQNFTFYERGMINVVKHLQYCFPNASILIVSIGDRSFNNNGVFETQANIPTLLAAQENVAKNCNTAFWNLFQAMGGYNSMEIWVDSLKLANKDYTHLNHQGADIIARKMYKNLMFQYQEYNNNLK